MKNMKVLDKKFTRDLDFNVNAYLGKSGLMKDEIFEVEFKITGKNAILYSERNIGVNSITRFENNELFVKTIFEGKMNALSFLCSLGSSCVLLSPSSLKEELKEEIRKMMENYF
jgi:predicted DNA-binding transcriptional regulator YafY